MAMNTARNEVASLLQSALPDDVAFYPYHQGPEVVTKRTVLVFTDEVVQTELPKTWNYKFQVYLFSPLTAIGKGDDELDAFLEDVLDALEGNAIPNTVTWERATRIAFRETLPAYQITINVLINRA